MWSLSLSSLGLVCAGDGVFVGAAFVRNGIGEG